MRNWDDFIFTAELRYDEHLHVCTGSLVSTGNPHRFAVKIDAQLWQTPPTWMSSYLSLPEDLSPDEHLQMWYGRKLRLALLVTRKWDLSTVRLYDDGPNDGEDDGNGGPYRTYFCTRPLPGLGVSCSREDNAVGTICPELSEPDGVILFDVDFLDEGAANSMDSLLAYLLEELP